MKKIRVIHVLKGKANPDTMNGVNKVVHNLASIQLQQGIDAKVWGITSSPGIISHYHDYSLELFMAEKNRFRINSEMRRAISEASHDTIFHIHSVFLPELYAVSRLLKDQRRPWVLVPHGGYAPESMKKNYLAKKLYKLIFENRLIDGAAAIHAIGHYGEADQFQTGRNANKVYVVPNGHTTNSRFKQDWSVTGPLRLCFCGRLARAHKGLDLLLQGLQIASLKGIQVHLDLIGDSEERATLEQIARKLGVLDIVSFHGMKIGEPKENLLLNADVFVHTSRWDVVPTAVLEAAGLGLPLLVTLPTNMASYVNNFSAGYVVNSLDPKEIARLISQAAIDRRAGLLSEKGAGARRMIATRFSWEDISEGIRKNIYEDLVGARQ